MYSTQQPRDMSGKLIHSSNGKFITLNYSIIVKINKKKLYHKSWKECTEKIPSIQYV